MSGFRGDCGEISQEAPLLIYIYISHSVVVTALCYKPDGRGLDTQ
jgi:hypothetical protein